MIVIVALREKCPYSELYWSAFSRIRSEYGDILDISPYSVRMRENVDQNNSKYGRALFTQCGKSKKITVMKSFCENSKSIFLILFDSIRLLFRYALQWSRQCMEVLITGPQLQKDLVRHEINV